MPETEEVRVQIPAAAKAYFVNVDGRDLDPATLGARLGRTLLWRQEEIILRRLLDSGTARTLDLTNLPRWIAAASKTLDTPLLISLGFYEVEDTLGITSDEGLIRAGKRQIPVYSMTGFQDVAEQLILLDLAKGPFIEVSVSGEGAVDLKLSEVAAGDGSNGPPL